MHKSLIVFGALLVLAFFAGAGAAGYIYPYTNIADYDSTLAAGDTLALWADNGQTSITLSGNGGKVFFESIDFVPGVYTKSIAGSNSGLYYVTKPDAKISIQIYDVAGSELAYSHGVSKSQGLVFKVTPCIPLYEPKALLFETPDGGSSTFFGTVNSSVDSSTGLKKQSDGSYVFTVTNIGEAGVRSGNWDVRVLYDKYTFTGFNMPESFLKSSSYNEQMSGASSPSYTVPTTAPIPTMTPSVLIKTPTPTPVKTTVPTRTLTVAPTSVPEQTPQTEIPTPVSTAEPTAVPASPAPLIALFAGFGAAAILCRKF